MPQSGSIFGARSCYTSGKMNRSARLEMLRRTKSENAVRRSRASIRLNLCPGSVDVDRAMPELPCASPPRRGLSLILGDIPLECEEIIAVEGGPVVGIDNILMGKIDYYTLMAELEQNQSMAGNLGHEMEQLSRHRNLVRSVSASGAEILAQYEYDSDADSSDGSEDQISLCEMLIL